MHLPITATQIKAARTFLDWSQDQLADATGLGKTTIRSLEAGNLSLHSAVKVRKAFEAYGLEFTDGDGVRRRIENIRLIKSHNGCDEFFEDILDTVCSKGGDILVMARTPEHFLRSCGITDLNNLKQIEMLGEEANIKCLLAEAEPPDISIPAVEFRSVPPHISLGAKSYYVYGDKLVLVCPKSYAGDFNFVILEIPGFAESWRDDFLALWEVAHIVPARNSEKLRIGAIKNVNVKYLALDISSRRQAAD